MDNLILGLAAAGGLVIYGCWPMIQTARAEVRFAKFKRDVRAIWRTEISNEDIIAQTGEDCWWSAFNDGQTPWEAVHGVEF